MSRLRWRRRLAFASAVLAAAILALAAVAWMLRDLPRRKVEVALAERLGADVALGSFALEGTQRFALGDLVVTRMAGRNRLRRLTVATLVVEGRATEVIAGRFALVEASGVEVVLGPPDPSIAEPTAPAAEVTAGRFRLSRARVILEGGGAEGIAAVEADLTGIGGNLAGEVRATSDRLAFAVGTFAVESRAVVTAATFSADTSGTVVRAEAADIVAHRDGREATVPRPKIDATLSPIDGGKRLDFTASMTATGIEAVTLSGTFDEEAGRLIAADADVRGVDVAPLVPLVAEIPESLAASGRVDATARLVPGQPLRWSARTKLAVFEAGDRLRAEELTFAVEGEADAAQPLGGGPIRARLNLPLLRGSVAGNEIPAEIAPVEATFEGRAAFADDPSVEGRMTLRNGLTGLLDAEILAAGLASAPTISARWRLAPTAVRGLLPDVPGIDGSLSAQGESAWPPSHGALIRGTIRLDGLVAAVEDAAHLEGGSLTAALTWPSTDAPISLSRVDLSGEIDAPPVPRAPIRVTGAMVVEPAGPTVRDGRFEIASAGLFAAVATGRWSAAGGAFDLSLSGVDLARWQRYLRPWTGDPAPGFTVNGTLTGSISGEIARDLSWSGSGTAAIAKSGFASEDGARVLEGLGTAWSVTVEGNALANGTARATARVDGFQVLWDSFFADGSTLPSTIEARGSFDAAAAEGPAWSGAVAWRYPGGPALDLVARGAGRGPTAYEVGFAIADLESTLATYLRAPLGDSIPWLTRIEGGGSLRAEARGSIGGEAISAAGRARIEDARIEGTKGFVEVEGLDLDLPFDLRWGVPDAAGLRPLAGPLLIGSLGFEKLEVGGLALSETSTPLRIEADTIGLDEGLALPLFDGVLGFEKLTLVEGLRPTRRAETAILIWGLQLKEAAAAFGLPPLEGAVDGYFPVVKLQGSSFEVAGGGEIAVFGGKVTIGDISGKDILTRFPKLRLGADFEGIDLQKVTGVFDFGEMTGIVRGHVHDLEFFRGTPTQFDARLETVPTKGIRNKVNVKAVNNLAIIGTGGVGILDRGIHKFIDEFTYDRIGVELKLANDAFLMRGLERRGSRELFLKGRLPFPIDVVNAQPGRTVSFRAMLDRLRAVDFSRATTR